MAPLRIPRNGGCRLCTQRTRYIARYRKFGKGFWGASFRMQIDSLRSRNTAPFVQADDHTILPWRKPLRPKSSAQGSNLVIERRTAQPQHCTLRWVVKISECLVYILRIY